MIVGNCQQAVPHKIEELSESYPQTKGTHSDFMNEKHSRSQHLPHDDSSESNEAFDVILTARESPLMSS